VDLDQILKPARGSPVSRKKSVKREIKKMGKTICAYVCICVHVCACMCMCMHVCACT